MNKPTIYIGADHAGFELKGRMEEFLKDSGYQINDLGAQKLDKSDDYPRFAEAVAKAVSQDSDSFGVLSCGNAQGVCIVANKIDGVRAGTGFSIEAAKTMRADDNANVICIPGRVETKDDPIEILKTFLQTEFSEAERHKRRLEQVEEIEESN